MPFTTKTMDKQNFCKPVVFKRKVIDIWCQYKTS